MWFFLAAAAAAALTPTNVPSEVGQYRVGPFLSEGGEAYVFHGAGPRGPVILRFPKGLCVEWWCTAEDLGAEQVALLREGCALASRAVQKWRDLYFWDTAKYREPPYAECYEAVSEAASDVAFEVWAVAGEETLHAALPRLTLGERRELLAQLQLAVAVLSTQPDPIVHHDMKFDNVMLKATPYGLRAVIIDFGASTLCAAGRAPSHTPHWVPYYTDAGRFPTDACWAYDTYDVGQMGLVAELLPVRGPGAQDGHAQAKASPVRRAGVAVDSGAAPRRVTSAPAGEDPDALQLLAKALSRGLTAETMEAEELFVEFVQAFARERKALVVPPRERLAPLFDLLRECPPFPEPELEPDTFGDLHCRFGSKVRMLHEAIHRGDRRHVGAYHEELAAVCEQALDTRYMEEKRLAPGWLGGKQAVDSHLADLTEPCELLDKAALLEATSQDAPVEAMAKLFELPSLTISNWAVEYELGTPLLRRAGLRGGATLLTAAAARGNAAVCAFLLARGADPLPAVKAAARRPDAATLPALLAAVADPERGSREALSALPGFLAACSVANLAACLDHVRACGAFRCFQSPFLAHAGPALEALRARAEQVCDAKELQDVLACEEPDESTI